MIARLALVAAVFACACGDGGTAPRPAPGTPTQGTPDREGTSMTESGYPNVHLKLRTTNRTAAVADQISEVDIWLRGKKFHIRDHACRPMSFILEDVTDRGGLGRPLESLEEMMDVGTADALREKSSPTEIYGDLASDRAWVQEPFTKPYGMEASELAPIAEQVLSGGKTAGLKAAGNVSRLGRAATEYRGMVDVIWLEQPHQNRGDPHRRPAFHDLRAFSPTGLGVPLLHARAPHHRGGRCHRRRRHPTRVAHAITVKPRGPVSTHRAASCAGSKRADSRGA